MFHDEPLREKSDTITPGEDLTILGVEQLQERKQALEAELARTEAMIGQKQAGLSAAEAFFKK